MVTVYSPVFSTNYIEAADDVNKIFSVDVCRPEESTYNNEALDFTYDKDTHTFKAYTGHYPEGTKVMLVTKHSNDIKTDLTKEIYGHEAKFSYYSTSYNTYSNIYEVGCVALDTTTIVALTEFTSVNTGNAEEAQNSLLYVTKLFTNKANGVNGGTQWYVTLNSDYDDVADAFDLTDGFLVTNSNYITIPSTVSIIEKNEGGKATKVKICVNNENLDGKLLNLWVNKGLTLAKNNVNENQIFFGCALDKTKAAASGYVQLASDEIEGSSGSASTYYNLSATGSAGGVQLSWYLEKGKGKTVYVYRGGTCIGSSASSQFFDAAVCTGTSYTYYLYDYTGVKISNGFTVTIPPKTSGACYTISVSDDYLERGYLYISTSHIDGTDYKSYKICREDLSSHLTTGTNYSDYDLENGKTYVYYVEDYDGNRISDKVSYSIPDAVFDMYIPTNLKAGSLTKVYWIQKSGLTVSYNNVYLNVDGDIYSYSSCTYDTFNGYYGLWYYMNVSFEPGETCKVVLIDSYGNALTDEYTVSVPKVYYTLSKTQYSGNYDKLKINLTVFAGERTACKLWKNDKVLAQLTDSEDFYIDEHAGDNPGEPVYYYVTDAVDENILYSDTLTYTVPAIIEVPVYVYEPGDTKPTETFKLNLHEYAYDFSSMSEIWNELEKKNSKYTSTDYDLKTDEYFVNSLYYYDLKEGVEIYLANKKSYAVRAEIPVDKNSHALSNDIKDFYVAENLPSGTAYWYKFKTEPGKLYTIQFYNSNTASEFNNFNGANSYDYGNVYIYLYDINEDKTYSNSSLMSTANAANISFVADKSEYLIKLSASWSDEAAGVRIVENLEENLVVLNMPAYNGNAAKKYLIPVGHYVRRDHTQSLWTTKWSPDWDDIKTFLEKEYGLSSLIFDTFTFYTDEACTKAIGAYDKLEDENIYAKENVIPLTTKAVKSYVDFTKIKDVDYNSSTVYFKLNLTAGETYVFEYLNSSNTNSSVNSYGFDYGNDSFISPSSYNLYVLNANNGSLEQVGNILQYAGYGCRTMFTAKDETYYLKVSNVNSDKCAAVNFYKLNKEECFTVDVWNSDESENYVTLYFLPYNILSTRYSENWIAYYDATGELIVDDISLDSISDILELIHASEYGYEFSYFDELGDLISTKADVDLSAGRDFKAVERTSAE